MLQIYYYYLLKLNGYKRLTAQAVVIFAILEVDSGCWYLSYISFDPFQYRNTFADMSPPPPPHDAPKPEVSNWTKTIILVA